MNNERAFGFRIDDDPKEQVLTPADMRVLAQELREHWGSVPLRTALAAGRDTRA